MKPSITAIILTYNESKHIRRCIESIKDVVSDIVIVDSFSSDITLEIASSLGARVFKNPWINYSSQFNWAITNCNIKSQWTLRIDADEYIDKQLSDDISNKLLNISDSINGIYVKRRLVFLNRTLKHGGMDPVWHLKLWRTNFGACEERWMDEHIKLTGGETVRFDGYLIDHNLNDLKWWTEKHNGYSNREAADLLNTIYNFKNYSDVSPSFFGAQEQRKRWFKQRYAKTPLFIRPFIYVFYRMFVQFGFLDGKAGLLWLILQGFWYRTLVDAKIFEVYRCVGKDKEDVQAYLKNNWKIEF